MYLPFVLFLWFNKMSLKADRTLFFSKEHHFLHIYKCIRNVNMFVKDFFEFH